MREALKGAKRPKPLCGDPVTAGLRLAAPFKPLDYPAFEGWPGLLRSPGQPFA